MTLNDGTSYVINTFDQSRPRRPIGNRLLDLATISNDIFQVEDELRNGQRIREVCIPLYGQYSVDLDQEIEKLIEFLFKVSIKVTFERNRQSQFTDTPDVFSNGFTCLFSGGLDSYSGILNSKQNYGQVQGAVTVHADQKQIIQLINNLRTKVLKKHGISINQIDAPENKGYTRIARGILYLSNALLLKNRNIIISEVGPTMYQPRFTELDDVSFTTHPEVIKGSKRIAEAVLGTSIRIIRPYENLTKAEGASISPEKRYLKLTCSCRTIRFCNSSMPNGDTCYGCTIRRIGMLVAGIEDSEFRNDILLSTNSEKEQYDNILHLLRFSLDFLNGYEDMPIHVIGPIRKFKKEGLFRRFSLDTFAALLLLKKDGRLQDKIFLKFLELALKTVSSEELENRISAVRSNDSKPDFQNII